MIFLTLHTGLSDEPYVLSLGLSPRFSNPASLVCLAIFVAGALPPSEVRPPSAWHIYAARCPLSLSRLYAASTPSVLFVL
jgi:hypothetical protein